MSTGDEGVARISDEEMLDLIAGYAVHALDDDEVRYVEAHLDDDPAYREALGRHLETTAALTVEAPVPESTWAAILTQTRRRSDPDSGTQTADQRGVGVPGVGVPGIGAPGVGIRDGRVVAGGVNGTEQLERSRVEQVIALDAARAGRRSRWRVAAVAAAATAAVVVPLTLGLSGTGAPSLAALAERASDLPGSVSVSLLDSSGRSLAEVVVTKDGRGYLRDDQLTRLPDGRTYQLWAITGATPVSAGLLGPDPGVVAFTVAAPAGAYALSIEPAIGSTQPTTTPIAVGKLA